MESVDKIRVLIADDSFFIRRYIAELLRLDPEVEVVGTASNGNEAVALAAALKPDVITMDYHMPERTGIEAAAAIMLGEKPLPAIIMLSAFEGTDGREVKRALEESGALVVTKPSGEISLDIDKAAEEIVKKIKDAGRLEVRVRHALEKLHVHKEERPMRIVPSDEPSAVIVIGASTGGPPLVELLLSALDPQMNLTVVIAQHMSKYFTELFAERLDRVTRFKVKEAESGEMIAPGRAYVIPGGLTLCEQKNSEGTFKITLTATPPAEVEIEIDRTMEVLAQKFGSRVYGVLLSGMGEDGKDGLRKIKECGGYAIVQDPRTAAIPSMPEHAVSEGLADAVLPAESIAEHIHTRLAHS